MRRWLALLVLVAGLVGCAPETGNVYGKHYHPSYVYATNTCLVYGKGGICTAWSTLFHTMPESFELCLDDGQDRGCRQVDSTTWHEFEVGDWYGG